MQYTDRDLGAIERAAWQRGDSLVAELAALAEDVERDLQEQLDEKDKELEAEAKRANDAEGALRDRTQGIDRAFSALDAVLASCKRIAGRKELEAAIQDAYNAAIGK